MMIKFNNILNELSSEFKDDYSKFMIGQCQPDGKWNVERNKAHSKIEQELEKIVVKWVGPATNIKGMRLESFMNKHKEWKEYMRDALRKRYGDTIELNRGIYTVEVRDSYWFDFEAFPMHKEFVHMYKNQRGIVDLMSNKIKYSSWTNSAYILKVYNRSLPKVPVPSEMGFTLTANIPIDDIIFCGQVFPRAYDEHTDEEFIVKHDKLMTAKYDLASVGKMARKILDDYLNGVSKGEPKEIEGYETTKFEL